MTKAELLAKRDYFNMVHRATLRAIEAFASENLGWRLANGLRSPRELVFHISTQEQVLAEAARLGRLGSSSPICTTTLPATNSPRTRT